MDMTSFVNLLLSTLTLAGNVFLALVLLYFAVSFFLKRPALRGVPRFFEEHGAVCAFAISLIATLGSLTYSDVIGYEPCKLCWVQRIFMYPQVILFGLTLVRKEAKKIFPYAVALSLIGAGFALYHYLLQIGVVTTSSCSLVGYSVGCAEVFTMNFGYITIPFMALTSFLLIVALGALARKRSPAD